MESELFESIAYWLGKGVFLPLHHEDEPMIIIVS